MKKESIAFNAMQRCKATPTIRKLINADCFLIFIHKIVIMRMVFIYKL